MSHAMLTCLVCAFALFFSFADASPFLMYEPGAPIVAGTHTEDRLWTYGLLRSVCVDATLEQCMQMPDLTLCDNRPESVSRTASILRRDSETIDGVYHNGFVIKCDYAHRRPENTTLVYTTNGTMPDIFGERSPAEISIQVPFNESNVVVARCIEPGKTPGRVAYVRPLEYGAFDCDKWDYDAHYKELVNFPECPWWELGYDGCDGQTILEQSPEPAPAPQQTSTPPSGSPASPTASSDPSPDPAVPDTNGRSDANSVPVQMTLVASCLSTLLLYTRA